MNRLRLIAAFTLAIIIWPVEQYINLISKTIDRLIKPLVKES